MTAPTDYVYQVTPDPTGHWTVERTTYSEMWEHGDPEDGPRAFSGDNAEARAQEHADKLNTDGVEAQAQERADERNTDGVEAQAQEHADERNTDGVEAQAQEHADELMPEESLKVMTLADLSLDKAALNGDLPPPVTFEGVAIKRMVIEPKGADTKASVAIELKRDQAETITSLIKLSAKGSSLRITIAVSESQAPMDLEGDKDADEHRMD